MHADLSVASRFPRAIRFVVVNNRVPCTDQYCALCRDLIEKSYIRDPRTQLAYCDSECFPGLTHEVVPVVQHRGRTAS